VQSLSLPVEDPLTREEKGVYSAYTLSERLLRLDECAYRIGCAGGGPIRCTGCCARVPSSSSPWSMATVNPRRNLSETAGAGQAHVRDTMPVRQVTGFPKAEIVRRLPPDVMFRLVGDSKRFLFQSETARCILKRRNYDLSLELPEFRRPRAGTKSA